MDLLLAKQAGPLPDPAGFDRRVRQSVAEVVQKQMEAGVDVVCDGEQGKFSYSTYVKDRLTGFEGENLPTPRADWLDFPEANSRQGAFASLMRPA